ncbi:MAG: single-stranded DNA-binding protein [Spiroplasma poulsonii]|uniref:Single-stranded DNA-binding protein n=2 Tax=Spiroplasma poulsonii TaxID=2138 RepID=A0A2P6F937_9MOLU|nr:single-stranded DNA-binding protein [Spiroplasma poulsonii]UXX42172.1 Single-stranded DNA-binding protein [Spiroplasma phage MaM-2019a]KAF0849787.1 Single-stranded DNA-binding protein ssb [Spiroplasma poulsonii]KAF0849857.1 Single-stranded DNA-binding protein ssb [Spiroplasma poulsonii]KAF0851848.1 Single-stranded DNA-binding protein ssb [Spiroplasma poulsonii]MBW1242544.1 single-stranded DNA-binding protein [Spiroplasma poulsonii]
MNKFIGIGRTTKDIEIKKTQNGKEYTIFQLAVIRPYSTQKETDFISCQVWNKQATVLQKYCQKGSQIAVTGVLQSFKNKDNKTEWIVQVSNYEFLHTNNDLKRDILLSKKTPEIIAEEQINYSSEDIKDLMGDNDAIMWD